MYYYEGDTSISFENLRWIWIYHHNNPMFSQLIPWWYQIYYYNTMEYLGKFQKLKAHSIECPKSFLFSFVRVWWELRSSLQGVFRNIAFIRSLGKIWGFHSLRVVERECVYESMLKIKSAKAFLFVCLFAFCVFVLNANHIFALLFLKISNLKIWRLFCWFFFLVWRRRGRGNKEIQKKFSTNTERGFWKTWRKTYFLLHLLLLL